MLLFDEVLSGLRNSPKSLPCKLFYDERGSLIFDRITAQDEYYLTRTEISILKLNIDEIIELIGENAAIVEYGSGSSDKVRILLDNVVNLVAYIPVDISVEYLTNSARRLEADYTNIQILPVIADYTREFELPQLISKVKRRVIFFPGSTIGNFTPSEAEEFLIRMLPICGANGGVLIGVDLAKDPLILHRAYNDAAGITAKFNLNMLARINREIGTDFATGKFRHYAFYNPSLERVEMHLVSLIRQTVMVGDDEIVFEKGESIHTESSYKYSPNRFADLVKRSGFYVERVWVDPDELFSLQYLIPLK